MARERGPRGPSWVSEGRELILGFVFGLILVLMLLVLEPYKQDPALRSQFLLVESILVFAAGIFFGFLLWIASRREREARRIHQAIANVSTGGVVVDDEQGRIVFANAKFSEMVNRPREDVVGGTFTEAIAPDSKALAEAELTRRKMGASSIYEIQLEQPDGSELTVLVSAQSLMRGRTYLGSAAFVLDITSRKRSERELVKAKELAEFFLDLITHDISNISQGIRGYAELLNTAATAPLETRKKYSDKIISNLDRANSLVRNIKKISELRWAAWRVSEERMDVEESLRQAIAMAMGSFPGKEVNLQLTNRAGRVEARADYLATELFYNLIGNAIKFTQGSPVEVVIEVDHLPTGSNLVRVVDKGPGIPDSEKDTLFSRIPGGRRAAGPSGYHSGTGLTLVGLISERFGWKVWVENRVQGDYTKGSAFCIEIPALAAT